MTDLFNLTLTRIEYLTVRKPLRSNLTWIRDSLDDLYWMLNVIVFRLHLRVNVTRSAFEGDKREFSSSDSGETSSLTYVIATLKSELYERGIHFEFEVKDSELHLKLDQECDP